MIECTVNQAAWGVDPTGWEDLSGMGIASVNGASVTNALAPARPCQPSSPVLHSPGSLGSEHSLVRERGLWAHFPVR